MAGPPKYSRTSQSRRPPFYRLKQPSYEKHLSIEDLELMAEPCLKDFDDGTLESVRRWYSELQEISNWLYQAGSPCLVDPTQPNQYSRHLSQEAFDMRELGRFSVSMSAQKLFYNLSAPTFGDKYVKPWKALSTASQEKLLLEAFASYDREDTTQSFAFSRSHKLVPEFDINDLIAEEGQGLVDLFNHLRRHLANYPTLSEKPIPNEKFFGKFGIGQQELPLSRADRAFHEEYLLKRHSLLFTAVAVLLRRISGEPSIHCAYTISDSDFSDVEVCAYCYLTAKAAGLERFLYCGKCYKVERVVPYCSASCQKKDWPYHKLNCSKNSSHNPVPIVSTEPTSASTDITPLRCLFKNVLEQKPLNYWLYEVDGEGGKFFMQGFTSKDRAQETRIRQVMRSVAFKALETGERLSIALLAATLFSSDPPLPTYVTKGKKVKRTPPSSQPEEAMDQKTRINNFRKVFDITSDAEWSGIMKLGEQEIEKPGNEVVKGLRDLMKARALAQPKTLFDRLYPPRPDLPDDVRETLRIIEDSLWGMSALGPNGERLSPEDQHTEEKKGDD